MKRHITIACIIAVASAVSVPARAEFCMGAMCFGNKNVSAKESAAKPKSKPETKKEMPATTLRSRADERDAKRLPARVTIWKHRDPSAKKSLNHAERVAKNNSKRAVRVMRHDLNNVRYTGNPDVDFASAMLPSQQGAVELAKAQLLFGTDSELKDLAMRTLIWQEASMGKTKQWLAGRTSDWRVSDVHDRRSVRAYKTAIQTMQCGLKVKPTGNPDIDFARALLPHHRGAVDIAAVHTSYGTDRTMRRLADETIRTQSQEIHLLQAWLDRMAPNKP